MAQGALAQNITMYTIRIKFVSLFCTELGLIIYLLMRVKRVSRILEVRACERIVTKVGRVVSLKAEDRKSVV